MSLVLQVIPVQDGSTVGSVVLLTHSSSNLSLALTILDQSSCGNLQSLQGWDTGTTSHCWCYCLLKLLLCTALQHSWNMALLLVLDVSRAECCEQKYSFSLKLSLWDADSRRQDYLCYTSFSSLPQKWETASPATPPKCISGIKHLYFPHPPGGFLQHVVRMLAGLCLLWILYSHRLLGIYLPRARPLYIWEIPNGNMASHLAQFIGKEPDVPCHARWQRISSLCTKAARTVWAHQCLWISCLAQIEYEHIPQAWLCTDSTINECALQLWRVVFYCQHRTGATAAGIVLA